MHGTWWSSVVNPVSVPAPSPAPPTLASSTKRAFEYLQGARGVNGEGKGEGEGMGWRGSTRRSWVSTCFTVEFHYSGQRSVQWGAGMGVARGARLAGPAMGLVCRGRGGGG